MSLGNNEDVAEKYVTLATEFLYGFRRLSCARIVSLQTQISLSQLLQERSQENSSRLDGTPFSPWTDVSSGELGDFAYISNASQLVYATTLLDGFFTNSTKLLYLMFPSSLGESQTLPVDLIIGASSKEEIVDRVVTKKVRELSYLSFQDRLAHLEKTFGLQLAIDPTIATALEECVSIRNVVVHVQSAYEFRARDGGGVDLVRTACPLYPTPVSDKDVQQGWRAYLSVAGEIFRNITDQVLKTPTQPGVQETIDGFAHLIKTTYKYNAPKRPGAFDAEELETIRIELESDPVISPVAQRGKELALAEFRACQHSGEVATEPSEHMPDDLT